MASFSAAFGCALLGFVVWSMVGLPLARRALPATLASLMAPMLGWACHSVIALLVFLILPFTVPGLFCITLLVIALSLAVAYADAFASRRVEASGEGAKVQSFLRLLAGVTEAGKAAKSDRLLAFAWVGALLVAIVVAAAVLPKHQGAAVILSDQIFDHAKVAIVDDIARLGLPAGNPFFANDGGSGKLAYYYLWHFSAAELSLATGAGGWDADAAMTFFSALTSLMVLMALAIRLSGRASAALWVVVFSLGATSRTWLSGLFGVEKLESWLPAPGGLGGWLFQASWVPQHLAGTSCVLIALYLMAELAERSSILLAAVLALSVAAGFETSTWVGGITFAAICVLAVPYLISQAQPARRLQVLFVLAIVASAAILIAWPFIINQVAAAAHRQEAFPLTLREMEILGPHLPASLRPLLDVPAYWLLLLPVEFTSTYLLGIFVMGRLLSSGTAAPAPRRLAVVLAFTTVVSLLIAELLVSNLASNNDLGWRAGLMAATTLIIFSAVGMANFMAMRQWLAIGVVACLITTGVPEVARIVYSNFVGEAKPDGLSFAQSQDAWAAVRALSSPTERIANNPMAFRDMTPWPVNISWSLLADRRSCYAGWELDQVYTSVPHDRLYLIDKRFQDAFAGAGSKDDAKVMAEDYDCALVLILPGDGAWSKDPFESSPYYRLASEKPDAWRIYRRSAPP